MDIWLVGRRLKEPRPDGQQYEILGVFDCRKGAVARCNGWPTPGERHWGDWIGRLPLNEPLPDEPCPWPEFYWVCQGALYDLQGNFVETA